MTSSSSSITLLDHFVAALEGRMQTAMNQTKDDAPTVRCRFLQGRLLVLSEAPQVASTAPERDQRFRTLALSISQVLDEIEVPKGILTAEGILPLRLYLRQSGTASPYAARNWKWQRTNAVSDGFNPSGANASSQGVSDTGETQAGALVLVTSPAETDQEAEGGDSASPLEPPASSPEQAPVWRRWEVWKEIWQDWPWRSVVGLSAVGIILGGITYSISRPCLIGNCNRRQTASDLSQAALTQLQGTPTLEEVSLAHADLVKAVRLLSGIPPWSPHYDTAQAELLRYRTQLSDLEWVIAAQKHATAAAEKSQNPPHPVPVWVEVHLLWQKAVTNLRRVPEASPLASFAQQKLAEYEANYETIGKRLMVEEQAESNLNAALQAGQLATTRTQNATVLAEWSVAQREWQRAVNALSRIPQGTLAYDDARSLLEEYRVQLVETRTIVNLEKAGDRAHQMALTSAAAAQEAGRTNQWAEAVDQWRRAITHLQQVPEKTAHYTEAQTRIDTYQTSLEQAQNRLQQAVALQTLDDDLAELCPLDLGICTTSYTSQQIDLILRDPYDSAIRQSISPPSTQGHLAQNASVVEQTHQLVQDIMRLGNRVQIPIALYDTDRQLIARYRPEYGGFARSGQ